MTAPAWPDLHPPAGVDTPVVCIDPARMEANIAAMAGLARARGVDLRPHAKTHKSREVARRQLAAGAVGITTATLGEAEALVDGLVDDGVPDVFVAYPVWPSASRAGRIARLAERCTLSVGVDSVASARLLGEHLPRPADVAVLVEVDSGERRTGVTSPEEAREVADAAAQAGLTVRGVFTHGGHSYAQPDAAAAASDDEVDALTAAARALVAAGHRVHVRSAGSTPTAALSARDGVTEIRPGTYVFGDRQQVMLGAHRADAIALFVAATVVSTAIPGQVVLDSGAKVLTKDRPALLTGFGALPAYPAATVARLYDHHAVVEIGDGPAPRLGEVVCVVPNHACPVVNTVDRLTVVDSTSGSLFETWTVDARGYNT